MSGEALLIILGVLNFLMFVSIACYVRELGLKVSKLIECAMDYMHKSFMLSVKLAEICFEDEENETKSAE